MAARHPMRLLGLVPGAAGMRKALAEFRVGGAGAVTALNFQLLRTAADLLGEDEELRAASLLDIVRECLALCDEEPRSVASHGLFVAALARTCEGLDTDSPFASSARFTGFHKALARTLEELYSWGLDSDALLTAAEKVEPETAAKLRSMAFLDHSAGEILNALGMDSASAMIRRCMDCKPAKGGKLPRVLIFAGSEVDPLVAQWIGWLAENGAEVWVASEQPVGELFAGAKVFASLLEEHCLRGDATGENHHLQSATETKDHRLKGDATGDDQPNPLCQALFTDHVGAGGPKVRITSCSDALAEAEWALRGCLADHDRGFEFSDIAVYARNLEEYACPLEAAATRLNVPLHMSRRVPVLTNRFARLVLEALEFCASDDPRLIIPMISCSYLALDRKLAADIRDSARTAYKAKRNAWPVFTGFAESRQADLNWLVRLLQWREDASRNPQSLRAWSGRLQGLIDILPWHGSSNDGPTRARDMRVPTALRRAIRNIASVRATDERNDLTLKQFATLCRQVWSDEEYSIPSTAGGVRVVHAAQSLGDVRSLYAIGMLEGVFPRRRSEDPILTDEDRNAISSSLSLNPPLRTSFDHASQERDEFYRLCAAASDSITLSYPQADDNRDNVPAFYLYEANRAVGEAEKQDHPRIPFAPPIENCISESDKALRIALDAPREDALPVRFVTQEVKESFRRSAEDSFSPQDLRQVLQCEFRYFVSKRLHLHPNREISRWMRLQRLPQHVRLLQQATQEQARNALENALEAELDLVYGEIPDWELALMRSGGKRLIHEWISREFESRKLWPKEAETVKVDIPFGAPGVRNRMPGDVALQGSVAAVSKMGPYAVSHLYEAIAPTSENGKKHGTMSELDVLYYGLHLLARHGQATGTAVEVEGMNGHRTLLVIPRLAEKSLLSRQDKGLSVMDLTGGADGATAQKAFFDEVKRKLKRAHERLQQSGIEPTAGDHCVWCGFGELCRRSRDFSEEDLAFGPDEDEFEND